MSSTHEQSGSDCDAVHHGVGQDDQLISLARHDLNLLVAFEALMRERHVSRAALQVGLSQSAMSHLLKRLRELFNDVLFIRTPEGMIPSPRAMELYRPVSAALANARIALTLPAAFDPSQSNRRFTLGMNDASATGALPAILRKMREIAPSAKISVIGLAETESLEALLTGRVELAFDIYGDVPHHIIRYGLAPLRFVCLADKNNPLLRDGRLDQSGFLQANHIHVTHEKFIIDDINRRLSLRGMERHIVCEVPFFSGVPELVRGTDLVAIIGHHYLYTTIKLDDFAVFPVPFSLSEFVYGMAWHQRSQEDSGHRWLRTLIAEVVNAFPHPESVIKALSEEN